MKLVYAIVKDIDSIDVTKKLNKEGYYVTKLASTGGFLKEGNTTLMVVTEKEKVDGLIKIVKEECGPSRQVRAESMIRSNPDFAPVNTVVNLGGATIVVVNVESFIKF